MHMGMHMHAQGVCIFGRPRWTSSGAEGDEGDEGDEGGEGREGREGGRRLLSAVVNLLLV